MPAANPFERAASAEKAAIIALWLRAEFDVDALRAARIATEAQWGAIAVCAGTNVPSEETRELVRALLEPTAAETFDRMWRGARVG